MTILWPWDEAYRVPPARQSVATLLAGDAYSDLQAEIMSDGRITDLVDQWSRCMAELGYSYRSVFDLIDELRVEAERIEHEFFEDHHDLSHNDAEKAVDELRGREITLALADVGCSEELSERAPLIAREYEVEFLQKNEAVAIEILDEMATG